MTREKGGEGEKDKKGDGRSTKSKYISLFRITYLPTSDTLICDIVWRHISSPEEVNMVFIDSPYPTYSILYI